MAASTDQYLDTTGLNALWTKIKDTFSPKTHTHSVKINGNTKTIAETGGTAVDLGTYLTGHQTIKQDGVTGATVNRFGTCSTAAGTAAKEVSITTGTFSLESGAIVVVKFTNANTASTPTLKVGTTDAKNIFLNGTQVKTGSNKAVLAGTVIFVYDGTQYHVIGNYDANSTYSGFVCGYCNTDAGTTTKSVTATNYVASTGNTILVRFTQANTAANKLSLTAGGVTGDLYINGKLSSTSNYTLPAGTWPCYYNGTNWYVWTDGTYQFGNLWYSAIKGEHQGTMRYNIHVNNTGSDPKGWCPIIRVTHTSGYGSYESVRVHGILYYGNGNWEQAEDQKLDFQAVINISSNTGTLLLGKSVLTSANYIRLIKIADRDYELQYNAAVANCDYDIYYQYEYGGVPESCITRYTTYQAATNTGTAITSGKLYDGSNAWQADQLTTARELAVSLSNTSTTTTFNGTAAVTNIKVSGQLADANIASASTWNAKQSALPTTGTPSTTYAINVSGSAGSAATATSASNIGVTTKNDAQIYLSGALASGYSSGAKVAQYADTGVFVTATSGQLQATSYKVTANATIQYNSTDQSLDFVFA